MSEWMVRILLTIEMALVPGVEFIYTAEISLVLVLFRLEVEVIC
jgi:hypothetical protein